MSTIPSACSDLQVVEREDVTIDNNTNDSPPFNGDLLKPIIEKALDELERVIYLATDENIKAGSACFPKFSLENTSDTVLINSTPKNNESTINYGEKRKECVNTSSPNLLLGIINTLDELLQMAHITVQCTSNDDISCRNVEADTAILSQNKYSDRPVNDDDENWRKSVLEELDELESLCDCTCSCYDNLSDSDVEDDIDILIQNIYSDIPVKRDEEILDNVEILGGTIKDDEKILDNVENLVKTVKDDENIPDNVENLGRTVNEKTKNLDGAEKLNAQVEMTAENTYTVENEEPSQSNCTTDISSKCGFESQTEQFHIPFSKRQYSFSASNIKSLKLNRFSEFQRNDSRKSLFSEHSHFDYQSDTSVKEETHSVMENIRNILKESVLEYSETGPCISEVFTEHQDDPDVSELAKYIHNPFMEEKLDLNSNSTILTRNFDNDGPCLDEIITDVDSIQSGNKLEVYLQDDCSPSTNDKATETTCMFANSYPDLRKFDRDWESVSIEGVCQETSCVEYCSDGEYEAKNSLQELPQQSKMLTRKLNTAGREIGFINLPTEILVLIFRRYLNYLEMATLGWTCQRFYQLAGTVVKSGLLGLSNVIAEKKRSLNIVLNLSETIEQRLKLFREYSVVEILESVYKMIRATTWKHPQDQTTCYTVPYILDEYHRTLRRTNSDHCTEPNNKCLMEFAEVDMLSAFCLDFLCTYDIHHLSAASSRSIDFGVRVFNLLDSCVNVNRHIVVIHSPNACLIHAKFLLSDCVLPVLPERKGEELSSKELQNWCRDFRAAIQAHNRSFIERREKEMNISEIEHRQDCPMPTKFSVPQLEPFRKHFRTKVRNPETNEENDRHVVETLVLDRGRESGGMITTVKIELECVPSAAPFSVQELLSLPPNTNELHSAPGWYDISMKVDLFPIPSLQLLS